MTKAAQLAARGYLPKELPLPFTSQSFGAAISSAPGGLGGKTWRSPVRHTLARPGRIHRALAIPHPQHFAQLAELVEREWSSLDELARRSPLSMSYPVEDATSRRALVTARTASERPFRRAVNSVGNGFVLRADVSQFYPSIYTHALDWAITGRSAAKAAIKAKGPPSLGALLDQHIRNGQDGQTMGIPIGPDTSLLLSELVLAQVDQQLLDSLTPSQRRAFKGFRYFDDYELFFATRADATSVGSSLQNVLADWQLTINPYKWSITPLPSAVDEEWVSTLKRIDIPARESSERAAIVQLFDEAFRLQRVYPTENVLAYALSQFVAGQFEERHVVHRNNWALFESLALTAALAEPATLPRVVHLLSWYDARKYDIDKGALSRTLHAIIDQSGARGEASELAWAVFGALCLRIRLRASASAILARSDDDVVALVALHAREEGLMSTLDPDRWAARMNRPGLESDHWLLAYEALHHKWLKSTTGADYVKTAPVFGWLRSRDVCFYDESVRPELKPRPLPKPRIRGTPLTKEELTRLIEAENAADVRRVLLLKGHPVPSPYE